MIRVFSEESIFDDDGDHRIYRFMKANFTEEECMTAVSTRGNTLLDLAIYCRDAEAVVWFILRGKKIDKSADLYFKKPIPVWTLRILISQNLEISMRYNTEMVNELVYHGLVPTRDEKFYQAEQFEVREQFLSARRVLVTLLALKRRRIHSMSHLDRFLIKELGFAIWITRYDWPLPEEPKHGRVIDVFGGTIIALGFAYLFPKMIGMLL